jgi:hypothetical protein
MLCVLLVPAVTVKLTRRTSAWEGMEREEGYNELFFFLAIEGGGACSALLTCYLKLLDRSMAKTELVEELVTYSDVLLHYDNTIQYHLFCLSQTL